MNYTIVVPEGTTNYGNPQLLCTPARWYDYILFIFANYLAHAATVVPTPGQDIEASICAVLLALILPGSAVARAVTVILRRAATESKDPLKRAARAGALCIVLKKPTNGFWASMRDIENGRGDAALPASMPPPRPFGIPDEVAVQEPEVEDPNVKGMTRSEEGPGTEKAESQVQLPRRRFFPLETWDNPSLGYEPIPHGSLIHGEYWLDKDYYLALVPPTGLPNLKLDVGEEPSSPDDSSDSGFPHFHRSGPLVTSSYNLAKLLIGLLQTIWAFITIYRARGNQIQQYGYAAFGLTVAPYATMSIINTIANIMTPEYPSIFVLRTDLLRGLESERKARFQGALDVVEIPEPQDQPNQQTSRNFLSRLGSWLDSKAFPRTDYPAVRAPFFLTTSFILSLVPLAIVGGLSGFRNENSTQMQRGFTMSWLALGIVYGVNISSRPNGIGVGVNFVLIFAAPIFGGMAIVGKMIHDYGVCTLLRE
ncbi:hypothetical protein QBC34DRAFT_447894 [Podospora aff. communis PSN243]|uniref:Uncharacterized protein n=1 Tax=Podospora aff. communis PSN243 TaxID=3040156 RepID=A0AAV9GU39_9PEZI|nr:hypothetical protein QBC34DRAFT_447894 [Podospora aff. communis PSN243]